MGDFASLLQQGGNAPWLMLPLAVALGALHGLEPGHAKSMMAAFIVAVRGTVTQAVVLGLCAMLSHTAVVWALALAAVWLADDAVVAQAEPYLLLVSGVIIIVLAIVMLARLRRYKPGPVTGEHDRHHNGHNHDGHDHHHHHTKSAAGDTAEDAHARAHAREIETRYAGRRVTTIEVALFGLSGGLLPCTAAVTVLILCLQVRDVWLGVGLVGAFSLGLAATLVGVGVAAAWGAERLRGRWQGLDALSRRAPYVSSTLVLAIGLVSIYVGADALLHGTDHHAASTMY